MTADVERLFRDGKKANRNGRYDAACHLLRSALALQEDNAIRSELADALFRARDFEALEPLLTEGRRLYPQEPHYIGRTAGMLTLQGQVGQARTLLEEAIETHGQAPNLLRMLAHTLLSYGETPAAIRMMEGCLSAGPPDATAAAHLLYMYVYDEELDLAALRRKQTAWARHFPAAPAQAFAPWDGEKPLRIGYVSDMFRSHGATQVLLPILLRHNRPHVHVTCYPTSGMHDALSMKIRFAVDNWRSLAGLDAESAADRVRSDGIDVLIDLQGHTGGNRLDVFARRPAPIQISAWGYLPGPGTPGIDYLVSDTTLIPLRERDGLADTIIDVPCPTFMEMPPLACSDPPDNGAEVRIGVFSRSEKISPTSARWWSRVLAARPNARLVFQGPFFQDASVAAHILGMFPPSLHAQIEMHRATGLPQYRHALSRLDLAFDTFPYSGGIVTLDALSQGTPVLTLPGKLPSSRTTASILRHWNLDALIAQDEEDFLARALMLIDGKPWRLGLREAILAQRNRFDDRYFKDITKSFEDTVMTLRRQA